MLNKLTLNKNTYPLIIGKGELGEPLYNIIRKKYKMVDWLDIQPRKVRENPDIVQICFPCESQWDFCSAVIKYVQQFKPKLLLIESTVPVGTTGMINHSLGEPHGYHNYLIAHSPNRGRIVEGMEKGIRTYPKFIGPINIESGHMAYAYYKSLGLEPYHAQNPQTTELGKLWDTTIYGILIAATQEMARQSKEVGAHFEDVANVLRTGQQYSEKILGKGKYHPKPVMDMNTKTKGVIRGHCVLQNVDLLRQSFMDSKLFDWLITSNELRKKEVADTDLINITRTQ